MRSGSHLTPACISEIFSRNLPRSQGIHDSTFHFIDGNIIRSQEGGIYYYSGFPRTIPGDALIKLE